VCTSQTSEISSKLVAVKFLRGTILHLSSKAHLKGEERMSLWEVIAFLEVQPIEKSWKQLIVSEAGDEGIRRIAAEAGELMLNSPGPTPNSLPDGRHQSDSNPQPSRACVPSSICSDGSSELHRLAKAPFRYGHRDSGVGVQLFTPSERERLRAATGGCGEVLYNRRSLHRWQRSVRRAG
jgi:hypothetical protein